MAAQPDDVTVTTATMTPDEIRESLGEPKPEKADKPDVTPEQEADDASKPDSALSEAGRTLRMSRGDARKAKLQAEIEDLARKRTQARLDYEREELERAQRRETQPPAKPAATPPAAHPAPDPDTFTFATYDQYQADHPDADYEEYTDARTDARFAWNQRKVARETAQREFARQDAEQQQRYDAAQVAFRQTHADYDAALESTVLPATPVTTPLADGSPAPLYQLIRNTGEKSPQILYYLAKHPEEAQTLAHAPNPSALIYAFAQMEMRATGAVSAPPAQRPTSPPEPKQPQTPITSASAPLTPVGGVAQHTRTLQSIADEDDDADAYIARRRAELKRTG
jgi:hypothetical protein